MDAATRAELSGLRRRAYGPQADIDGDGAAVRRLIELEELALHDSRVVAAPERAAAEPPARTAERTAEPREPPDGLAEPADPPEPAAEPPAPVPAAEPPGPAPAPAAERATERSPHRRRWGVIAAVLGGVIALAIVALVAIRLLVPAEEQSETRATLSPAFQASRAAYSFARDPDAVTLLSIPLDGSFGSYIDLPTDGYVPEFPTMGEVGWAMPLGEYFGWNVWIAGATIDSAGLRRDHCLVAERGEVTRGRCVPATIRSQSALLVDVPYTFVRPEDRPVGMSEGERLGFWWNRDRAVTVLIGDDPLR